MNIDELALIIIALLLQVVCEWLVLSRVIRYGIKNGIDEIMPEIMARIDLTVLMSKFYEEGEEGDKRRHLLNDFMSRCGQSAVGGALETLKSQGGNRSAPGESPNLGGLTQAISAIPGIPGWASGLLQLAPLLSNLKSAPNNKPSGGDDWHA